MGIETALAIGAAVAGTATASYSAVQQNRTAQRQKGEAAKVASINAQQVRDAAAIERLKTVRRSAQIRGRLRLAGAEAGLGDLSSLDLLEQQNELDTALNLNVLRDSTTNSTARIGSQLSSELARLSGLYRNELVSGFEGALGGAQQGLQIGYGIERLAS